MDFTRQRFNRAKSEMLRKFNKALADAGALSKAELEISGKKSAVAAGNVAGAAADGRTGNPVGKDKK